MHRVIVPEKLGGRDYQTRGPRMRKAHAKGAKRATTILFRRRHVPVALA